MIVLPWQARFDDANYGMYAQLWLTLLSDSPLGLKPRPLLRKFYESLVSDFALVAKTYATLFNEVVSGLVKDDDGVHLVVDYAHFKRTPIAKEIISLHQQVTRETLRYVLSFLSFGKRCPYADTEALQAEAFRSWMEVEERIGEAEKALPEWLSDLKVIITTTLAPHFSHVPLPSHGSGRVSEEGVKDLSEKHLVIDRESFAIKVLSRFGLGVASEVWLPGCCTDQYGPFLPPEDRARLKFAYKNISTLRSICMEPVTYQYAQQSVRFWLEKAIERSPLHHFIRIKDQSYNSEAARLGSMYHDTDTLDLSAASDSLLTEVVRRVFPSRLLKYLLGTRSRGVILPDGSTYHPKKFAPMGSACCFPVQSIVYASVILRAYCLYLYGERPITPELVRTVIGLINHDGEPSLTGMSAARVYGDDLVVDSRVTQTVIAMLTSLGFKVNTSKSFMGSSPFRESCGGYFVNGMDVKPVSLKLSFKEYIGISPGKLISSMVSLANRAHEAGFMTLAHVAEVVAKFFWPSKREYLPRPIYQGPGGLEYSNLDDLPPFVTISPQRRIYGKYTSKAGDTTCELYQRDEGKFLSVVARLVDDVRDDVYSYYSGQRTPYGNTENALRSVHSEPDLTVRWAWKPV